MVKLKHSNLFPSPAAPVALAALLAATLTVAPAGAQQASKTPPAPGSAVVVAPRDAATEAGEMLQQLLAGATAPPSAAAPGQRQPYELSLLDAVEMALRHNLNLQVARFNPQSSFHGVTSARGNFDPQLQFSLPSTFQRGSSPTTNQTQGGDVITTQNISGGFTWTENLEWGTNYRLQWNSGRRSDNNEFATFNPSLSAGLSGSVTQQLLRGFGDVNRTGIRVSMNSYDQSLEQFRGTAESIILQVVTAYWNLRGQAESVRVQEQTVALSEQQFERNQIQVEIGTLAPIETVQAETQVARDNLSLIQARNAFENAQDNLKELLNFEAIVDDPYGLDIVPIEDPEENIGEVDVAEAIQLALDNDPTLASQRIGLRSAELQLRQAENSLLPALNVTGSFNLAGRGGTRIIRSAGIGGEEVEIISSGFGTALGQVFSGDFNTWSLSATLSLPLNNHTAKASAAQRQIAQRQQLTQFEQRRQQVTYDIRQQARTIANLAEQVSTATISRELSDRQLDAELRKFEVGSSTNFQVLQFQQQFSQAQLQELQAIVNLQNAIAQLEFNKGTLLQHFGVQIGSAGTGGQGPGAMPGPLREGR